MFLKELPQSLYGIIFSWKHPEFEKKMEAEGSSVFHKFSGICYTNAAEMTLLKAMIILEFNRSIQ